MSNDQSPMTNFFVHESSYVDDGCRIGKGTKIWHFCHIMHDCTIGEECNIGQNVVISPNVVLGRNCKVQNNVSVYTGVRCEDDVFLGPSMVFTNVLNPRAAVNRKDEFKPTLIRRGATIGANATIVCYARRVLHGRCRFGSDQRCTGIRAHGRQSRPSNRMGQQAWRQMCFARASHAINLQIFKSSNRKS